MKRKKTNDNPQQAVMDKLLNAWVDLKVEKAMFERFKNVSKRILENAKEKLTDEEIAKAILQSIEYNKTISYIDEWGKRKKVNMIDIINFINRIKEEKELYKNQFNELEPRFFDLREENAQLKAENERLKDENKYWREMIERFRNDNTDIRKETAREYYDKMKKIIRERDYVEGYAEIGLQEENDEIAKQFGVEI